MSRNQQPDNFRLFTRVMIIMLILVLLGVLPFLKGITETAEAGLVFAVMLNLGLVASLIVNFFLFRKIIRLQSPAPPPRPKAPPQKRALRPPPPPPPINVDPKELPDPGLVYRFDMSKEGVTSKRIVIGQRDGTIKTFSTEIIDNHLELEIRVKEDSDRDLYSEDRNVRQSYQIDFRRGSKVMIYYPGSERYREMDARERIVIQQNADKSGDFQYQDLDPKHPIRFQLGDRLRHDGKFQRGYIEFHLFTKEQQVKVGEYVRQDKIFLLRVFKIFPGYDTAHPTEEGMIPMIDPFVTR